MTSVDEIADVLEASGVIVLPTDTVYGLVALPTDPSAISRLFAIKARPVGVPLAVLCASVEQALGLADLTTDEAAVAAVAERWWPGPLTLVLPRRADVSLHLGEPPTTVGLRVPDHDLVRAVAARVGPIAVTSANRHQEAVAETASAVQEALGEGVAMVVDGGRLEGRSSTVVDATSSPWSVLRAGPIGLAEILATASEARG